MRHLDPGSPPRRPAAPRATGPRSWRFLVIAALTLALAGGVYPAVSAQDAVDELSVAFIERRPKIDYVWGSEEPGTEGWPRLGRRIRWVAHVRNLGERDLRDVGYRWLLDGEVVSSGTLNVPAGRKRKVRYRDRWDGERHELVLEVDPADEISELEERNNRLLVHTDALAVGIWVERGFWDGMRDRISSADIGAVSFDDWMQRRIRQFNEMAALARYPDSPDGVLDRWRIDAIRVVPDGALPLSPLGEEVRDWGADPASYPTLYPDTEDRSVDMQWGFPADVVQWFQERTTWALLYDSFLHELGHARYLIDVYAWNVDDRDSIRIDPGPPANRFGIYHLTSEHGMMNTSWGYIDRYSAVAMNRIAGQRATHGHYNEPANIGVFLGDLPESNRVRLVTPDGETFPNSRVRIYRAANRRDRRGQENPYRLRIDGNADLTLRTDEEGAVLLGRNPFTRRRSPVIEVDRNNALVIVEVIDDRGDSHWGYLEARLFNLAYWRGYTERAEHELVVDAPVCGGPGIGLAPLAPGHEALVERGRVTFEWPGGDYEGPFELWTAVDGGRARSVTVPDTGASRISHTLRLTEGDRVAWWVEYRRESWPEECPFQRSATFFFDLESPR